MTNKDQRIAALSAARGRAYELWQRNESGPAWADYIAAHQALMAAMSERDRELEND